ncbi:MAG: F0F1 ATP synthase subunit delta [bacterium]|nr:MAG: F0F1 ATP synthase subunit delta [bacterium]
MIITSNAKRYAKALFELAQQKNQVDRILEEFKSFLMLIEQDAELHSFLNLPYDRKREQILSEQLKRRFSELFFNFLLVVLKNKRLNLIHQIYASFENKVDSYYHRVRAEAITAFPLSDNKLLEVSHKLAGYLNTEVTIENRIDPSIIGGIIIRLNGKMFNGSLSEQFKKLKHYLEGGINQQ